MNIILSEEYEYEMKQQLSDMIFGLQEKKSSLQKIKKKTRHMKKALKRKMKRTDSRLINVLKTIYPPFQDVDMGELKAILASSSCPSIIDDIHRECNGNQST